MNGSTIRLTEPTGQDPTPIITPSSPSGSARVACAETNNACGESLQNRTAAGSGKLPPYVVSQCVNRTWGFKTAIGTCTGFFNQSDAERVCKDAERQDRAEALTGTGVIAVALRKFFYPEQCTLSAHSDEMIFRKIAKLSAKETRTAEEEKTLSGLIAERDRRHGKRRGKDLQP